MSKLFLPVYLLALVACAPSLPPVMTPPQRLVSIEWTSEKRSEWLHKNCKSKGTAVVGCNNDRWCDYNARCMAERAGANVVSIIYQFDNYGHITQDLMMFLCK